jgi:DNA repair protein RadC
MEINLSEVRERALTYGITSLSERELLRLLKLPTGKRFSEMVQENNQLARAVLHLADRHNNEYRSAKTITSSLIAYEIFKFLQYEPKEQFWILILNRGSRVKKMIQISKGSSTVCVVDAKEIVKLAVLNDAQGIILCHNHPSGSRTPSQEDKSITQKVKQALSLVDVNLLDHIIVACNIDDSDNCYHSFADNGEI